MYMTLDKVPAVMNGLAPRSLLESHTRDVSHKGGPKLSFINVHNYNELTLNQRQHY